MLIININIHIIRNIMINWEASISKETSNTLDLHYFSDDIFTPRKEKIFKL